MKNFTTGKYLIKEGATDPMMYSSLYNPQCRDCFLRFKNYDEKDSGCKALISVPQKKCSFHKTPAEQETSLLLAARRNGDIRMQKLRLRDLKIF